MIPKRAALQIHIWFGITIGAFWALQGLTGALLVFNRELQQSLIAPGPDAPLPPLDRVFASASMAAGAPVHKLERFGAGQRLLLAYYDKGGSERTLVIDGPTGRRIDDRDPDALLPSEGSAWPWLLRFHEGLLGGDTGQMVVGTSGAFLLSALLIGAWNAWPARGRWREMFRISRWRAPLIRLTGWHRMVGMLVTAPLLLIATCGIYLAFAPELRPVLARTVGYQLPYKAAPVDVLPSSMISAEQALHIAQMRFPGSTFVRAVEPTSKSPVYLFRLLRPGDWRRWAGTSVAVIDPASGKIVADYDSYSGQLANRITDNLYPIHTGEIAGLLGRIPTLLAGLALPILYTIGLMAWFKRRALRRKAQGASRAI